MSSDTNIFKKILKIIQFSAGTVIFFLFLIMFSGFFSVACYYSSPGFNLDCEGVIIFTWGSLAILVLVSFFVSIYHVFVGYDAVDRYQNRYMKKYIKMLLMPNFFVLLSLLVILASWLNAIAVDVSS